MISGLFALFEVSFLAIGPLIVLITFWLDVRSPRRWRKWFIRVCQFLTFVIIGLVLSRQKALLLIMSVPAIVFGMVLIKMAVPKPRIDANEA